MLARIKKDSQNNLTWERLTSTVVGSTPLGAVYGIYSNSVPDGFLPCNGVAFDRTQYPFLYNMLGDNHTPDLRECTLVGIGENSTDVTALHDIYTLGQYKDFATAGSGEVKTAGYTVSGNNVTLNTTVNAANRKLVTQYIADADATDLQTLDIGGDSVTRMRSKGINYIIKAIPGNEIGDYNYVIDQMEAQLALKVSLDYVNALPTGDAIENNLYGYNGHYYVGYRDETDPENDSFLTELVNQDDLTDYQPKTLVTTLTIGGTSITTVEGALAALNTVKLEKGIFDVVALPVSPDIEDLVYRYNGDIYFGDSTNQTTTLLDAEAVVWVDENDPLPTGASIKAKVYVQPETVSASVTKYHYYVGDTSITPHVLREIESGGADIFVGTLNDWNLLSTAEQNAYTQANITDANGMGTTVVDTVQDGNLNAVSSNAVYDSLYRSGTTATSIYSWSVDHAMTVAEGNYNFTHSETLAADGWYLLNIQAMQKHHDNVMTNYVKIFVGNNDVLSASGFIAWCPNLNSVVVPLKAGTVVTVTAYYAAVSADDTSVIHFDASIIKLN